MACLKGTEVLDKQGGIKGIGVIVIEQPALFKGQLIVALVVAIMVQHAYICAKVFLQLFGHGGFSAAGTARDPDHHRIHKYPLPRHFFFILSYFGSLRNGRGRTFCAKRQKTLDWRQGNMVQCE